MRSNKIFLSSVDDDDDDDDYDDDDDDDDDDGGDDDKMKGVETIMKMKGHKTMLMKNEDKESHIEDFITQTHNTYRNKISQNYYPSHM